MCPLAYSQCPEGPASGLDTLLEGQSSCIFCLFFVPPPTSGWQTGYFVVSGRLSPFQEAVGSVYNLLDLILVLDCPRYIPLAIHNIAQVGVLVGGVHFLALQGHISGQLPAYSHYSALGGIHSHFPSVRPSDMVSSAACKSGDDLANSTASSANSSPRMREVSPGTVTPVTPLNISLV
ncbi:hypothetical protein AYI70_g11874 [Smittium culicis]|uniref:Uncharacterized protein n=1 Tax=Smittium culicis TaxID=133412 RepID=A0A1R1WZW5_9FUNG|nr:hypothetical protein AYI70_g11874 [Smittium culicis]